MVHVNVGCSCLDWFVLQCGLQDSEPMPKAFPEIWKEKVDFLEVMIFYNFSVYDFFNNHAKNFIIDIIYRY